jgi:FlgD Ig-like domain
LVKLLPTVVVLVLLGATAAAFTVTQRLKLEDSPILNVQLDRLVSPVCKVCKPEAREALIRFRLVKEDDVAIDIVDSDGVLVREELVTGHYEPQSLRFSWDGRDNRGRVVADGLYRVRVKLEGEERTLEFPQEIRVDATVPVVEEIRVEPAVFSPDGDGRADQVNVVYRFNEAAYPVLYVDGQRHPPGRRRLAGAFQWYALRGPRGLPPGEHRLALAAQDPVGNLSPSTREFTVRIRYIELSRPRYRTRPGARLRVRVSTDALSLRYQLAGRGRIVEGRVRRRRSVRAFMLRVPRRPGRYLLTVRANGRLDRAVLLVRR